MEPSDIRLSIALVTRNRPESLERTLISLRAQCVQPWEVIVSDDSNDTAAAENERIAGAFACRYIKGPHRGLYANRNHVALACRGTHIRTMDDDHEFPIGHMSACLTAVQTDPDSIWIIGEFLVGEEGKNEKKVPCPGQLHPRGFSVTPPDTQNCWAISCGGTIYPREVFFDKSIDQSEEFKFGAVYLEFGSRLHFLGWRIRHLDSTYLIHHFDPKNRSYQDLRDHLPAMFYAMFCHSFLYRRTSLNQLLSILEVVKQIFLHGPEVIRYIRQAYTAFRRQRQQALYQVSSCTSARRATITVHE